MSMIAMKKLLAVIPVKQRDALLKELMYLGCIEVSEHSDSSKVASFTRDSGLIIDAVENLNTVRRALDGIERFCTTNRKSIFESLRPVSFHDMDSVVLQSSTVSKAASINHIIEEIERCNMDSEGLNTQKFALAPWQSLTVPLDIRSGKRWVILFGSCPVSVDPTALQKKFAEDAPESSIDFVSTDAGQRYLFILCHRSCEEQAYAVLKEAGFSAFHFKNLTGTAQENIAECNAQILLNFERVKRLTKELERLKATKPELEFCVDALSVHLQREGIRNRLLNTPRTVLLQGWVPSGKVDAVAKELNALDCAFEFTDPLPEDEPPVAFTNSRFFAPFGIISNLYGTPKYGSVIDPTPYMAPFFFIFFGMMVSDAAYGMILALTSLWALRQLKQEGFLRQLLRLVLYCGISTMIWGILFGSWFGDIVPAVTKMFTGKAMAIPPLLVDPLKQPMEVLGLSFALGGIQILEGLWLCALRKIRTGKWLDAVFDEGLWFLILMGLVGALLKFSAGLQVAEAGAIGVILTAGRNEKNPVKRLLSGILSLYKITGYLSDVLSYSRLLALGLASGVIASVINSMGTIGGNSLGGIIALVLIFLLGHTFNLAINLVGAYVHASRLQYVEFFSKFYEGGGRPFAPFAMVTKYVTPQKED